MIVLLPIRIARRFAHRAVAVVAILWFGLVMSAAHVASITYVNLTHADATTVRVAPSETIRFTVSGIGSRPTQYDAPPAVSGGVIEFTLAFNAGCFATPPAFGWRSDLPAPAPGVYKVRYFF